MSAQVHITGAGVAGLVLAAELTARGADVSIWDRNGAPGPHGCSWWAGGMLAPFCEGATAEPEVVRWGQEAADWWHAFGVPVTRSGTLVVAPARDGAELARFARRAPQHDPVDSAGIDALEPDLAGRFSRGLYYHDEAHLDPRTALARLITTLHSRGVEVARTADASTTGTAVVATGYAARHALTDLRGVKGEMLVLHCLDVAITRPIRLMHPRFPAYLVPRGDGVYMLGATQIESADGSRVTARSLVDLLNAAYAIHPAFADAEVVEIGVDLRPAFPDNLPRIRWVDGALHVNGLFRHGFLLAPALGRMAADHILNPDQKPEVLDESHPERLPV
ncbi:MAG: FAD-dependent oxidoreductase [Pseudomonadota bacterium]